MAGEPALTDRDRRLLQEVQRHGALTRDQAVRLGLFSSKTRANERLKRLSDAGYLRVRPQPLAAGGPRHVYLPGPSLKAGAEAGRALREAAHLFLDHHLGIVDLRIAFERHVSVSRWLSDKELGAMALGLVPDAYVEYEHAGLSYSAFVEYDRGTETLARIEAKARAYADLAFSGRFERAFGRKFFRALFVADSPRRLATMSGAVARVTDRVVRLATRADVIAGGPAAPLWVRPGATATEPLTQR